MPRFAITAQVIRPVDTSLSRVTDLVLGPDQTLYSTTRFDGLITTWDISGIAPALVEITAFDAGLIAGNQPQLATVMTDTGQALLSGGGAGGAWTLRDIASDGTLEVPTVLDATLSHPLIQPVAIAHDDGTTSVYAGLNGHSGLVQLDLTSAGAVDQVRYQSDTGASAAGDITALTGAMLGDTPYLIGASTKDAGITAWQVFPSGALSNRATLRPEDGLRLATPSALESAVLEDETYVIAAGATSDSLTVLHLAADRSLSITDHVLDDRNTRFAGVTALATTTHEGQVWVFAGGADDGISAFQLLPGGRLLHRAQIADTPDSTLANISALAVRSETGGIAVFATSATEAGLTELRLSIDPADQVIIDTAGVDVLTGGAGDDVFVLGADGAADTITDFTLGEDRVDLSAWGGLRSKAQLTFDAIPDGLRITYGEESLRLQAYDSQAIDPDVMLETDLIGQTTLPLTLEAGESGPVTAPPALPARYIPPAGTPAPEPPIERVEDYGSGADDDTTGGLGNDLLFGQSGDDQLRGSGGDDLIFGGLGRDRLDGGGDDDQLFGGEGRDMGWIMPARPVQDHNGDNLNGGAGNDRLYGQAGRDRLDGGAGDDLLLGGAGRDSFVFRSGHDVIADFDPLADRLILDPDLWEGALSAAEVVARYQTVDGDDLVLRFDSDHSLRFEGFDAAEDLASQLAFL